MITRSRLLFCVLLIAAIAITLYGVPVASPQGISVTATYVAGDLPLDNPASPLWQQTTAVEIPLNAQNLTRPMLLNPSVRSVIVRALRSDSQVALLVEWPDATRNDSLVRAEDFRDAVAVQFPLVEHEPFFCMGQQDGGVNIWHWKADWQADLIARHDIDTMYPNMYVDDYPHTDDPASAALYLPARYVGNSFASVAHLSPVESLVSIGFGSLTALPGEGQNVQGYGEWADGRWRVIFSRDLLAQDFYTDLSFTSGKIYPLAFAVWDGANQERGGQKSTSQWVSLNLDRLPAAQAAAPVPADIAAAPVAREGAIVAAPPTQGLFMMFGGMLIMSLLCMGPLALLGLLGGLPRKSA
jgi:hypothetical protein